MATATPSKRRAKLPGYLLHKPSGRARVRINGQDIYLGPYGSDESRIAYAKEIARLAADVPDTVDVKSVEKQELLVSELVLAFIRHAKKHYRKDGKLTTEYGCYKQALRPVKRLFGKTLAKEFGPLRLTTVQAAMVEKGWVRKSINRAICRVRHVFKWAVSKQFIDVQIWMALQTVQPLQEGRTDAPDNPEREAVPDDAIEAVKADVSPLVRDLIEMQRLIGCRSSELLCLTTGMLDRSKPVWEVDLKKHKTAHNGKKRFLHIGPKAQAIMLKYLKANRTEKLFSITRNSYCTAVTRSCARLNIDRWVPHQLRHTLGSIVRDSCSLDHSQAVLGHSKSKQTEEYARLAKARAIEVASKIG